MTEGAYNSVVFGKDEPEVMWISSPLGAIMLTKEGHFLCDDAGNVVGEVERSYADQYFERMSKSA